MTIWLDLAGVVFGVAGLVLSVSKLLSVHRDAPMLHRLSVGLTGFLCFVVAANASVAVRSIYGADGPSAIAVGFAFAVSCNWLFRLERRR